MNIFGITGQYLELLQMAEDGSLDQDMINDTLEGVDWEFEEKADAYAKVMNSLDGTVAKIFIIFFLAFYCFIDFRLSALLCYMLHTMCCIIAAV